MTPDEQRALLAEALATENATVVGMYRWEAERLADALLAPDGAVTKMMQDAAEQGRREFACEVGALIAGRVHLGPSSLERLRMLVHEAVPRG